MKLLHCYYRRRRKPCRCSGRQEQSCGHRNHRQKCRRLAQSLLLSRGLNSSCGMSRLELLLLLRVVGAEAASADGEGSAVDPPEPLAATGVVAGSVWNRSCLIWLFRAVYDAAKMCGTVL
ncbi:uncharacterized protein [Arachis hypogaea]|uniref:uncharacterized protein isoform X2 n=1 Tax=Arachis hypogaea TaxID=3818 RepID=UPI000DECE4FF|nr:uncharacterized protein LOC112797157 [Arachis hypogaea]QHO39150.1 uncharacterized protein DS421_4g126610 [Arachis hypogaea]